MEVTAAEIRELVNRAPTSTPVTSVYLNTDGARFPRAADYETRLEGLLREVRHAGGELDPVASKAVHADADAIARWVRREFERGDVRGLALFASGGEIFERAEVAVGVRNIARVAPTPYVVPLEGLLGRHHHIGLAIVARDRARVFRYRLGRLQEHSAVDSVVHGQHEQGGWAQARYQRNIEHDKLTHMKDVAEILRLLHEDDPLDALTLAGPGAEVAEFSKLLHPYLRDVLHGDALPLSVGESPEVIKERLAAVEQALVSSRRRQLLGRLAAAQGQAGLAARGIRHVLEAANAKRIETLFVVEGAGEPGYKSASGALALHADEAAAYGTPVEEVPDLIDHIIETAVRSGAHIELFRDATRLDGHPVAALLRF